MGIPTSVWFIIAAVALVAGLLMLRAAQRTGGAQPRDRRRWAQQKEWEYLDSDPVLPSRWRYGTIHQGGPGVARNLVTGSVPTAEGRRLVYVFDHEQAGRLSSVVAAVQRRSAMKGAFELRLPSAPLPDDAGLDLLEPVGQRYAFVSDAAAIRPLITPRLIRAADAIGDDVELLWGEDSWVLCTAPLDYAPDQLQDLLDQLVEVAGALEEAAKGGGAAPRQTRAGTRGELSPAEPTQPEQPAPPRSEPPSSEPPKSEPPKNEPPRSEQSSVRPPQSPVGSSAAAGWARSLSSRSSTVRPLRPIATKAAERRETEESADDTADGGRSDTGKTGSASTDKPSDTRS